MFLFVYPYLRGSVAIAHRLLPLACLAIFLGIVWFDLGSGLNVPALVWHDDVLLQTSAGFSIASLFAYIWLVTYILDATYNRDFIKIAVQRTRRSIPFRLMCFVLPPSDPNLAGETTTTDLREGGDGLRWYLGATFFPCALLLLLPAFFVIDGTRPFVHLFDSESTPPNRAFILERWPFALGVLINFAAMRAISSFGNLVRRQMLGSEAGREWVHKNWLQGIAVALLGLLAVLYGGLWVSVDRNWWQPPPVTAVCMLFGLAVGISGAAWFYLRLGAVPILVALVAWIMYCDASAYKLHFPHLEPEYASLIDLEDYEEPALLLKEVDEGSLDRVQAEKEEAERVCKIVAAIETQRKPSRGVTEVYKELESKKYTDPRNYEQLIRLYNIALDRMDSDEKAALDTWKTQFKPNSKDNRPKLVIVTATGGANRSGLWTAKVLYELHRDGKLKDFSKHLRIITGASGGMVGASYYVGSVQADGSLQTGFQPEDIAQDFLTPIVNSLVFREIPLLTIPCAHYDRDRGEMLDRAMEGEVPNIDPAVRQRLNNVFSQSFADLAPGEKAGWRPSMIFSPMIVEDGRRLLISNRHVPFLTVSKGDFLLPNRSTFADSPKPTGGSTKLTSTQTKTKSVKRVKAGDDTTDVYSRPAVEFFRLFPESRNRFHVSTAARMNATFPFVSPAVSLPTHAPRRVVDAGYFDNTGVSLAAAWLHQYRDWVAKNCSGVVMIQIRDFASHRENRHLSLPAQQGGSFLPGLTGPLSAVDHARSASASYRNDDDVRKLGEHFRSYFKANAAAAAVPEQFFTTVVFERYTDVGMNWYLSKADKQDILDSWDQGKENMNPASLQKLREWWDKH